ncbi:MAG: helix-turn-helix domain-containing protein [Eubacteriales bacterium]|nr:helix-turn-helix domain-containing protein [Eubacteriales bacterium]
MNEQNNKQLLLDTARKLFIENGYESTSISAIRTAAGLSNGTFYHYFSNKEDLLVALCDTDVETYDLLDNLENKVKDPLKYLTEYFISYSRYWNGIGVELASQTYRLYDKMFLNRDFSRKHMLSVHIVEKFLDAAQQAGTVSTALPPSEMASLLYMVTRGVLYEWILLHGNFDLIAASQKYTPHILKIIF